MGKNILDSYNSKTGELIIRTDGDRILKISRTYGRGWPNKEGYIISLYIYILPYIENTHAIMSIIILEDGHISIPRHIDGARASSFPPARWNNSPSHGLHSEHYIQHKTIRTFWYKGVWVDQTRGR